MKKVKIKCTVAVHQTQANIIKGLDAGTIDLENDTLRDIGLKIGIKNPSPQQVKHHLGSLVKLGVLDWINGYYKFNK